MTSCDCQGVSMYTPNTQYIRFQCILHLVLQEILKLSYLTNLFSDFKIMPRLMFLLLLLPIALGQTTLRGTEVKVTTVTHRPFIMPNNSTGER